MSFRQALNATVASSTKEQINYHVKQSLSKEEKKQSIPNPEECQKSLKNLEKKINSIIQDLQKIYEIASLQGSFHILEVGKEGKDVIRERVEGIYKLFFLAPYTVVNDRPFFAEPKKVERKGPFQLAVEDYFMERAHFENLPHLDLDEKIVTRLKDAVKQLEEFLNVPELGKRTGFERVTAYPVEKIVNQKLKKIGNSLGELFPAKCTYTPVQALGA